VTDIGQQDGNAAPLDLTVGAVVVYGSHGIGRVSAQSTPRGGDAQEGVVIIEFSSGLSVSLPLDRARTCLRPLADVVELDDIRATLRTRDVPVEKSWQAMSRTARAKISAGEVIGLAEVVRDTAHRKRNFTAGSTLSSSESVVYLKARHLLAAELVAVADLDETEAQAWIDEQLNDHAESGDAVTPAVA
jgi:RNA polymerase-interacting CarD/CdnL/TRCF family regulator